MRTAVHAIVVALAGAGGVVAAAVFWGLPREAGAASNDRYQDYIMATGAVSLSPRVQTDGVWLLDYKSGKLLGTVIDRVQGKIVGWAEVDLAAEFGLQARADVHFLMTCGYITQGQSALYLAETTTGQFGVYTMGPGPNGTGISIRRHDLGRFRHQVAAAPPVPPPGLPQGVGLPGGPPQGGGPQPGLPPAAGAFPARPGVNPPVIRP